MPNTLPTITKILSGHISPETAYVVDDYPFGFRLRCKIRYWLEYVPNKGVRFWSQTTNPKTGNVAWNKAKASTYFKFGGCMFLDENNHVQWSGLSEYSDGAWSRTWSNTFREGVPPNCLETLDTWVKVKEAYDARKAQGQNPLAPATVAGAIVDAVTVS